MVYDCVTHIIVYVYTLILNMWFCGVSVRLYIYMYILLYV